MKVIAMILSAYLFTCYSFGKMPTPEGLLLVFVLTFTIGTFSLARANREVSIYFTKDQIDEMMKDDNEED